MHLASILTVFLPFTGAYVVNTKIRSPVSSSLCMTSAFDGEESLNRRQLFQHVATTGAVAFLAPRLAWADISDGNALPKGAAEFSRSLRLKSDLKAVMKRVKENASEIDKKEWDNISKFLRMAYTTGDDLKVVANGIFNADNKARALEDISQLRKYAQAGDIPVSKQDAKGFLIVADKMAGLLDDFFDSLSDVPDEL